MLAANSFLYEPLFPRLVRISVPIAGLPSEFEGYRIAHLTDLHYSPTVPGWLIEKSVETVRELNADLVAVTGDFVTSENFLPGAGIRYMAGCAELLGALSAPDGVFAVLGNHDNHSDSDVVRTELEKHRIRLLVDEGLRIERGSSSIWLAGVDDYITRRNVSSGLGAALEGRAAGESTIMLAHNPDQIDDFVRQEVSLALCGHTHGGQVAIPFVGPPFVPSAYGDKYAAGLFREGDTQMWVCRGVGTFVIPVRFHCRAEIAEVTLTRGVS